MSNEEARWAYADQRCGTRIVCATISAHGMQAFHTTAAYMGPGGDYIACGGGRTFKMGLVDNRTNQARMEVRPGCEKDVQQQLDMVQRRTSGLGLVDMGSETGDPEAIPDVLGEIRGLPGIV